MVLVADRTAEINGVKIAVGQPFVFESLELPSSDYRTQDVDNPVGDGRLMGRDRLTPGRATLNVLVLGEDAAEVETHRRAFTRAWNTAVNRTRPGAVTHLDWRDGGRTTRVYGRPRTVATVNTDSRHGLLRLTAAFDLSEAAVYDVGSGPRSVRIDLIPPGGGGLTAPLTAPLMATGMPVRQGIIQDTGGDAPTPFRVVFRGPISNPWLRGPGWEVRLNTSLAWDETVTVDTRTGTVVSSLGRNMKPFLGARSRLRDATLKVGSTELTFGGNDPTATAFVEVQWTPAFYL